MKYFLVVGGTGVMGTSAIQAVREHFGQDIFVIANWYGKEIPGFQIENADHTVFGDINDPACRKEIKSFNNGKYIYTTQTYVGSWLFPVHFYMYTYTICSHILKRIYWTAFTRNNLLFVRVIISYDNIIFVFN